MTKRVHISEVLNENIRRRRVEYKMFVTVAGKRRIGTAVKFNNKTAWVKVFIGAKTHMIIKRHKINHALELFWATKLRRCLHHAETTDTQPRGCPALD